ncbi:MAG: hypothetical protein ISR65_19825 [Bacteriovoracaceae bacterium]|nr:hypothetical protein [Bacteriovoracaceae bacterium]
MKNLKTFLVGMLMLAFATQTYAAIGSGNNYWAASADIVGMPGAGIVVTDSTYSACQQQFQTAMANHTAVHGWQFTNIKNCHYVVTGSGLSGHVVGVQEALQLDSAIAQIEEQYNVAQMQADTKKVVKKFLRRIRRTRASRPVGPRAQ